MSVDALTTTTSRIILPVKQQIRKDVQIHKSARGEHIICANLSATSEEDSSTDDSVAVVVILNGSTTSTVATGTEEDSSTDDSVAVVVISVATGTQAKEP